MNARYHSFFVATLAISLSGCDASSVYDGGEIIKQSLRSPSSYSLVSGKQVWAGKSAAGDVSYIVRIEYDAQNGFGATIRDCKFVAYSVKGSKVHWNQRSAMATCESPQFDQATVEGMRKYNFQS